MTSAAFMTRDADLLVMTTKFVKQLTEANRFTGPALVPYYRQILPYFNQYYKKNKNTADKFEYDQRYQFNLGDVIAETLEALERTGGPVLSAHRERPHPHQEHGAHLRNELDHQQKEVARCTAHHRRPDQRRLTERSRWQTAFVNNWLSHTQMLQS